MINHEIYLNIKKALFCEIIQKVTNPNKKDLFAPYYVFPFMYIIYFTFGSIELTNLSYPSIESKILIILGVIFYLIGTLTSLKIFSNEKFYHLNESGTNLESLIKLFIILNIVCTITAIVIQSVFYGAPILDPNLRMTMSPKLLGIIVVSTGDKLFFIN